MIFLIPAENVCFHIPSVPEPQNLNERKFGSGTQGSFHNFPLYLQGPAGSLLGGVVLIVS